MSANTMNELLDAIGLVEIGSPYRTYGGSGGIWSGINDQIPDANFIDWGLARATAIILNAVVSGRLVPKFNDPTPGRKK
jgi:hypothetical protein